VVARVSDWAIENNHRDPINYVFECGDLGWGEVKAMFDELPADQNYERRELMGTLSFGKKQRLYPLQAADIWAYENYKHMINQHMPLKVGEKKRPPRIGYAGLMRKWWAPYNTYWDFNSLSKFAVQARARKADVFESKLGKQPR
jgi:hypothetical protein